MAVFPKQYSQKCFSTKPWTNTKYIENNVAKPAAIKNPVVNKLRVRIEGYRIATKLAIITKA